MQYLRTVRREQVGIGVGGKLFGPEVIAFLQQHALVRKGGGQQQDKGQHRAQQAEKQDDVDNHLEADIRGAVYAAVAAGLPDFYFFLCHFRSSPFLRTWRSLCRTSG